MRSMPRAALRAAKNSLLASPDSPAPARPTTALRLRASSARSAAVRASAGSGKTRTLVDRFVRLCVEGEHNDVHPRSILAITFTRRATVEIQARLQREARRLANALYGLLYASAAVAGTPAAGAEGAAPVGDRQEAGLALGLLAQWQSSPGGRWHICMAVWWTALVALVDCHL